MNKKAVRYISFILVIAFLAGLFINTFGFAETQVKAATVIKKGYAVSEYERGIEYGFIKDGISESKAAKKTVTYKQFCSMVAKMIKKYDKSKLSEWKKLTKKASKSKMKRDAATIALLYAAETIGLNTVNNNWHKKKDYDFFGHASHDYGVFDASKPLKSSVDQFFDDPMAMNREILASFVYVSRRKSCITGYTLLEPTGDDWRMEQNLTYKEAVEAVVRLYESVEEVAYSTAERLLDKVLETPEAKEILDKADERRDKILNSETQIVKSTTFIQGKTYTGTAYYVSNNGDDNNSGTSEDAPWRTLDRVRKAELKYGDAIFFKRGSKWYGAEKINLDGVEGITLSAYGSGEKPVLSGALENSSGAPKWSLYYSGKDGRKIWKYYKQMPEAGVIVFDDGKAYAKRDMPYWDGSRYYDVSNGQLGKEYNVKKHLEDMCFFPDLNYPADPFDKANMYLKNFADWGGFEYVTGTLYLRCDAGNPGELYDDIEISTPCSFMQGMPDYGTADNLCFTCSIQTVAGGAGYEDGACDHLIFQNCVASWMGGGVYDYGEDFPSIRGMGGGFNVNGTDEQILNCYTHHCYQEGPTLESFKFIDGMIENCRIEGNLTEYCTMGNMITNWDETQRDTHLFKNLTYKDNMVLFSGFENLYTLQPFSTSEGRDLSGMCGYLTTDSRAFGLVTCPTGTNAYVGKFEVTGNVFAFAFGKLIEISSYTDKYSRVFSGNTYAQLPGFAWLSAYNHYDENWHQKPREIDPKKAITSKLKDKKAVIVRFD